MDKEPRFRVELTEKGRAALVATDPEGTCEPRKDAVKTIEHDERPDAGWRFLQIAGIVGGLFALEQLLLKWDIGGILFAVALIVLLYKLEPSR